MEIRIRRAIIHLIDKEQGTNPRPERSESTLDVDTNVVTLVERLNDAFRKDGKVLKTEFREEANDFQIGVDEFCQRSDNRRFVDFATNSLNRMVDLMVNNNLATGGYFVYIDYQYRNRSYIAVFIVRDSEEIIFKKSDELDHFVVNTTTIVDTSKLAMAVRIDLDKLANDELRYLHFTHRQQHLSSYFIEWIEADLADKSAEDTATFIHLINSLPLDELPINPDTQTRYNSEEFRNIIYDNINSAGRLIRIRDLSSLFWNDEDYLTNKIEVLELDINEEFQATPTILKRLKRLEIKEGKLKLTFTQNDLDRRRIRLGDNDQIIIESSGLRQKLQNLSRT